MFLGTWDCRLDPHGWLSVPAPFQHALDGGLIVTRGFDQCLQGFAPATWETLAGRISDLPLGQQQSRSLRRLIFAEATRLSPDSAGQILLPPGLLTYANLRGPVVVAGMDTFFEIWSREQWQRQVDALSGALGPHLPDLQLV